MHVVAGVAGALLIVILLWDVLETVLLPRRVTRRVRVARIVFYVSWRGARMVARRIRSVQGRESLLGFYGPTWMLLLLMVWAGGLILGYALLEWSAGSHLVAGTRHAGFGDDVYVSGTTFFTLGLGDVTPQNSTSRTLLVLESATGFFLLALVIGYLPTLYQAFSRRETSIVSLDAEAGSPPCATELLRRAALDGALDDLSQILRDWQRWSAELLESHISYPVLALYRSQHDNQSWLAALTMQLDLCSLLIATVDGLARREARLTFAIARHCAVDLGQILGAPPRDPDPPRLDDAGAEQILALLGGAGVPLRPVDECKARLVALRHSYEPYVAALGERLLLELPPWLPPKDSIDNWKSSAWERDAAIALR